MKLEQYLDGLASMHGRALTAPAAHMFLNALSEYPEGSVLAALDRCVKELRTFPTIADIIARIHDGRPGVEEAWALCPRTEDQSVVWTSEVRDAFFMGAAKMIDRDEVAARMAFKESYTKILSTARANNTQVNWEVSLGQDKRSRESALLEAVQKQRISLDRAKQLLPDVSFQNSALLKRLESAVQDNKLLEVK